MIVALLFAAASSATPSVVDAEMAFARDAQKIGQWTAFRKYADRDAVMFTPQAVWARDFLRDRKNPPRSLRWWPTHAFTSCDGRTGVTTGNWIGPDNRSHGFFTTIWQRTPIGWRWVYAGGEEQKGPMPVQVRAQRHMAVCTGKAPGAPILAPKPLTAAQARTTPEDSGRGQSADKTLGWDWKVEKSGARQLRVLQWNGAEYAQVLINQVSAPKYK